MSKPRIIQAAIKLWLEIEELGRFDAVDFQSNWGVSEIPAATVSLAVGRQAADPSKLSQVHTQNLFKGGLRKAEVYAEFSGDYSETAKWPEKAVRIFDGYLTGISARKITGQLQFTANIVHWLSDLNFSAVLSESSHPSNPADYTFPAVFAAVDSARRGAGLSALRYHSFFTPDKIEKDLWAKSFKPFFIELSQKDNIKRIGDLAGFAERNLKNDAALAALKRIEGPTDDEYSVELSSYTPPLALNTKDLAARRPIAGGIYSAVGAGSVQMFTGSTLWNLLAGYYGPEFLFNIIPLVERALVVPLMPGYRKHSAEIKANDYDFAELSGQIRRPLAGVAILGTPRIETGATGSTVVRNTFSGFYPRQEETRKGMLQFFQAPAWLAGIKQAHSVGKVTGIGRKYTKGTSTTPQENNPDMRGDEDGMTANEIDIATQPLYDRYAQSMFIMESLRGRDGALSGKLRFDISPGAIVKIEGKGGIDINQDQLGKTLFGFVQRVSVGINAETGRAGTGFHISAVRSEEENEDPLTSTLSHPLYEQVFSGAPLVDEYNIS